MIRQKKRALFKQPNLNKIENFTLFDQPKHNNRNQKEKQKQQNVQNVFEQGILNKFFKISINNQNPNNFTVKGRQSELFKKRQPSLFIQGRKNCVNDKNDKQNHFDDSFAKSQYTSKIILLQTTGNAMLPFKNVIQNKSVTRKRRPFSAANSFRSTVRSQCLDNSLSRVLQQLNQNNTSKNIDKISTSKALIMFSKVIKSNQNSSRQLYQRKIKQNQKQHYKSVSLLANQVKIESKQKHSRQKLDFKSYLKRFNMIGGSQADIKRSKPKLKEEDYSLQGWQTGNLDMF